MQERNNKWSVGAWMTPNPTTVSPDLSVKAAYHRMRSEGFRHLLVVEDGTLQGIVTDRDLRRPDLSQEPDGWHDAYQLEDHYEVRHIMTTRVETVAPQDDLKKALGIVLERKYGALPVLDKTGSVIGILSTYDLMRAMDALLERAGDEAGS